ncbi:MAG TPA: nucleotidyltransferase family protein [Candidatus Borkfalkia avicola]|uniref:tRNA(Met) cytidine acetate ligase n=1 Tax=Candidatus Borkfalkia avicola TaxID=2838503 RepID=A0A9D2D5Q2_9FIRM|nr:nucleotidyltransferase family protein [Candidatus Borkfalkia avicola]
MKICGIVCEFNPLHNGHAYLLAQARARSGCDALVCVMSGNFTQRGEPACMEKYTRAEHAILAGADAVIELPAAFACAPAELFARGAIRLLAALPNFDCLAFGCESGDERSFRAAAASASAESGALKSAIRGRLDSGMSLTRARAEAAAETGARAADMLSTPNNILGVEYAKALLAEKSGAALLPVKRVGAAHGEDTLRSGYSSATAVRRAAAEGRLDDAAESLPPFVYRALAQAPDLSAYKSVALYAALSRPAEEMRGVLDCTEGLENRIRSVAKSGADYDELIAEVTSKRYISSRIRRILAAAVLGIGEKLVRDSLKSALYFNVLAVRRERADELLPLFAGSVFPAVIRREDERALSVTAKLCYAKDIFAEELYASLSHTPMHAGRTVFV